MPILIINKLNNVIKLHFIYLFLICLYIKYIRYANVKFKSTLIPIFLFLINNSKQIDIPIKQYAPPKFVIAFAIGVAKSDIKYVDTNVYPLVSVVIISLSITSSNIIKKNTILKNNIIHFKFCNKNIFKSFIYFFIFFLP